MSLSLLLPSLSPIDKKLGHHMHKHSLKACGAVPCLQFTKFLNPPVGKFTCLHGYGERQEVFAPYMGNGEQPN